MKKLMIMIAAAIACCSCRLDDGGRSYHTAQELKEYASQTFNTYVLSTAQKINLLLQLDDYINASEEERLADRFTYLRNGLVRNSESIYHIYYTQVNVDPDGKSFRDPSGKWELSGMTITTLSEDTWKVTDIGTGTIDATIKDLGLTDTGNYILEIMISGEEEGGLYISGSRAQMIPVKAGFCVYDSPLIIRQTSLEDQYYYLIDSLDAQGTFHIDITKEGNLIDWISMKLSSDGNMGVSYYTSLD